MSLKSKKVDDLKLKNENLIDQFKQLKSRHQLLMEKVKKHAEYNCSKGDEITRFLNKLNEL